MVRGKVLVVEDESRSRQGLARLLENRDLLVEEAPSGEVAVRKVEQEPYDIVFLDLGLSKMDGRSVLNRLLAARPDLCVVILTAEGTIGPAVQAMKRGAFHYLAQPVDATALDVLVRNALERSHLIQQNATLRQEALLDDQTTAYNRRFMETYLEEELERARRYGRPFSLIFFDLDHLKKVND
ncbi:MAG TPA: response regulator, partial [Candidatus Methylomirabilis sp.]